MKAIILEHEVKSLSYKSAQLSFYRNSSANAEVLPKKISAKNREIFFVLVERSPVVKIEKS